MNLEVSAEGLARRGAAAYRCALGRGGVRRAKREGDGATPEGGMRLVEVLYRPDQIERPATTLPVSELHPSDGWCDDPADAAYNRKVTLPYPASCERLWRGDRLYDLVAVTDYNMDPVAGGAGSAIFVHVAGEGFPPTEGCIAFALDDLREILARWRPGDRVIVG